MRTTIDLPADLLRRAKATAALRGMKLKDLVAGLIESGLDAPDAPYSPPSGHDRPIPVTIRPRGWRVPVLTNAEVFDILDREDDERHGRSS